MSMYKSSLAQLKISNGATFHPIAGLKRHHIEIQHQPENSTHIGGTRWREIAGGIGSHQASITGNGIFTDSEAEQLLISTMLDGATGLFQLELPNGHTLEGEFLIVDYRRAQDMDSEETFSIRLESAGSVTYS